MFGWIKGPPHAGKIAVERAPVWINGQRVNVYRVRQGGVITSVWPTRVSAFVAAGWTID